MKTPGNDAGLRRRRQCHEETGGLWLLGESAVVLVPADNK